MREVVAFPRIRYATFISLFLIPVRLQTVVAGLGLPGGDRTPDPQLRRLLLYPTELRAEIQRNYGRGERIRTFDPLVPNQMRYQAALRPDWYVL